MTPFASQITFLDLTDYAAGKEFLTRVLGLEPVYDIGWAAVYGTAGKAFLGIVHREAPHPSRGAGLLISLTTDQIEAWHRRIGARVQVSPIAEVQGAGLRSFFFTGPEGYRFEVQQFTEEDGKKLFCQW